MISSCGGFTRLVAGKTLEIWAPKSEKLRDTFAAVVGVKGVEMGALFLLIRTSASPLQINVGGYTYQVWHYDSTKI